MDFLAKFVFYFLWQFCLCSVLAKSTSKMCNENEYLHVETGLCSSCTVCDGLGLVTWVSCTARKDALCAPKWTMRHYPVQVISDAANPDDFTFQNTTHVSRYVSRDVFIGVLIGLVLATTLVIVIVCLSHQRRQKISSYNIIYQKDLNDLHEIANEMNSTIRTANIYVHAEEMMTAKSEV